MMDEENNVKVGGRRGREVSVDKLELRLGPPTKDGGEERRKQQQQAVVFAVPPTPPFGHFQSSNNASFLSGGGKSGNINALEFQKPCNCSSVSGTAQHQLSNGSSQKRVSPSSAIGWPPIRSFRKKVLTAAAASNYNLNSKPASSNSETTDDHYDHNTIDEGNDVRPDEEHQIKKEQLVMTTADTLKLQAADSLYVKIYMDGFPIGRKVNLKAHDNYQSLSSAVDQLFRCILPAAQGYAEWSPAATGGNESNNQVKKSAGGADKEMTAAGLLDGDGEYTLVYEDNEGDKVLVGDVPWNMFLSTAKRLRVLKSSELRATRASQRT